MFYNFNLHKKICYQIFKSVVMFTTALLFLFTATGCLEDRPVGAVANPASSTSWFNGITAIQNLGGSPIGIKVNWEPNILASGYRIYLLAQTPGTQEINWNLIETLEGGELNTYVHRDPTNITAGRIFTYRVRALDFLGLEDSNIAQMSTIGFEGVTSVEILSNISAKVTVNTSGAFSSLKVIAHPTRLPITDITQDASGVITSSQKTLVLNDLKPGTTYSFRAQALTPTGEVDGNEFSIRDQTPSDSYGTGATSEGLNQYQYRNIRLVQAFGAAPNELNTTNASETASGSSSATPPELTENVNPHKRMVRIVPNPFANTSGKYRAVRAAAIGFTGNSAPATFDTATSTPCTITTSGSTSVYNDNSCVVCDHSALTNITSATVKSGQCDLDFDSGIPNFIDKAVAPPKKKYFYTITKVKDYGGLAWPEELPLINLADFLFSAHIPDNYMVLVHRESANYEMCSMLNKTPDPKKWNHCAYTGLAATPYSTAGIKRDLPAGFYDFGYNLLVDRHALSCNWTGSDKLHIGAGVSVIGEQATTDSTEALPAPATSPSIDYSNLTSTMTDDWWTCKPGGLCLSLGLYNQTTPQTHTANHLRFGNETTSGSSILIPNAPQNNSLRWSNLPNPDFTPQGYTSSPMTLFNLQTGGNNCYVSYFAQADLLSGDAAASATLTSAVSGTWQPVGRIADLTYTGSMTNNSLKTKVKQLVAAAVTIDPGPLQAINGVTVTNRKRPTLTGLTGTQAQALCNTQDSSYGVKRLWRRREFIAATPISGLAGEPGFVSQSKKTEIETKNEQTLYNRHPSSNLAQPYGAGTSATLGRNSGTCSTGHNPYITLSSNPGYAEIIGDAGWTQTFTARGQNHVVSVLNDRYCYRTTAGNCSIPRNHKTLFLSSGTAVLAGNKHSRNMFYPDIDETDGAGELPDGYEIATLDAYIKEFLSPLNEGSRITIPSTSSITGNAYSNTFFIGSLATNKCVSRFGLQDPYLSTRATAGGLFYGHETSGNGYVFSDLFIQTSTSSKTTTAPVYEPISNSLDLGVYYDYTYNEAEMKFGPDSDESAFVSTGRYGNATKTCGGLTNGVPTASSTMFTDNYYYYNARSTKSFNTAETSSCRSDDGGTDYDAVLAHVSANQTRYLPQGYADRELLLINRNANDFSNFLPVLGLALKKKESWQDAVDMHSMIYSNQFARTPTSTLNYARFYSKDVSGTKTVNMTSGKGGRWSYEISESDEINNAGAAWCVVEAE